ncbi:M48 family metalloprotease [Venenivibrio stagnispumantis]|uniref:Zn-dependent protease, contains TPR repeats n=1 Tax=Venenivibrio stagnispumantis TaxID=407998 RepID=A0AA45WP50_9AQUI|nr:M48 family metalloprotease [Venenivibrio stagnispumantis]MCW4573816.1 M48 family metalloprotease [Venenivibrio stagnispumantis]SMP19982.1 Putative Zn-dependent protease, contains TPR repeats [Venenivibrio stagnispumantis]
MKKLILLILLPFILISCAEVQDPLTGKKTFTLLPEQEEIAIGQKVVPQAIEENEGQYPDEEVRKYISNLGWKIATVTPRKLDYKFYIVNSNELNAFALPGGFIFINKGLVEKLNNESELAGVIAHELGHVNARHHAKFLEKQYGINILLNILSISISNSQYYNVVMNLASISANLLTLKFSRDQESEADALGVRFSYQAGYDPNGLVETFYIFKELEKSSPPEWLLTHPLPDTRIQNVKNLIATYPKRAFLKKDSQEFQYIKSKILKQNKSFELINQAKNDITQKNFDLALRKINEAISIYPQNSLAYTYRAYIYLVKKDYNNALNDSYKAINIDNLYFRPKLFAGIALTRLNKNEEAINILNQAISLIPDNPDSYYYLGLNYEATRRYQKAAQSYNMALKLTDGKRGWEPDAQARLRRLTG